ncbi:hypothetical protein [Streptomyces lavendulae]|uniref:hypothetical protein n=1 Tax=Streptomyces lavendulae TaxID=1914 RepID=UPI0036BB8C2D
MADDHAEHRMKQEFRVKDTAFTKWLFAKATAAGWDAYDPDTRARLRLTAALIRTGGGGALNIAQLAEALKVSEEEITKASAEELTANLQAQVLFEQPELTDLDARLDDIGYEK